MDGGRRRRMHTAAERQVDRGRKTWYGTYRSLRFTRHYRGTPLPELAAIRAMMGL
jgi:hypothetical protein